MCVWPLVNFLLNMMNMRCAVLCVVWQYFDYVVRVLMPEILVKIVMQIYDVSAAEAELKLMTESLDDTADNAWYARRTPYSISCSMHRCAE